MFKIRIFIFLINKFVLNFFIPVLGTLRILNLYFDQGYFIKVPLISLYRTDSANFYYQIPQLAGQVIVWPKCYVQMVTSAAASAVSSQSFVFNVYYSLK